MPYNTIITKATKKGKVVELGIDVGLRNEMVCSIRDRIIDNLQATKRFLELGETYKEICAGIYTYAIEEYGKILFLNSLSPLPPPNNDKLKVPYTHYNHGFLDHFHKFELALYDKNLPYSCKVLRGGDFTFTGFSSTGFITDTPADFEARKSIFYADFDGNNNYNSILTTLQVDRDLLKNAVDEFLKFMDAQKHPIWVFMIPLSALTLSSRIGMAVASMLSNGSNNSFI
jgi:hypothetical protein